MPAKGHKLSNEARLKVSMTQKGRKHTPQEGFQKGHKQFNGNLATQFKKGTKPWNYKKKGVYKKDVLNNWSKKRKGIKLSKETIKKIQKSRKGYKPTEETKRKISNANKGKHHGCIGDECWNWKGGITPERNKIRSSIKYKNWVRDVFKRDNYI